MKMDENCVFCDKKKIIGLFAERYGFYINASVGQISDGGYVLIIPKEHVPCLGALNEEQTKSFLRTRADVWDKIFQKYHRSVANNIITFEHGIVGQTVKHAHLHILPTVVDLTPKIRADFPEAEFEETEHKIRQLKLL